MSTVDKVTADKIVAGEFPEDAAVLIVKYTNAWGGEAYGVTFARESLDRQNRYLQPTPYINNPEVYWRAPK
jgi:hypothetical protein